jgi:hypothetical protein
MLLAVRLRARFEDPASSTTFTRMLVKVVPSMKGAVSLVGVQVRPDPLAATEPHLNYLKGLERPSQS